MMWKLQLKLIFLLSLFIFKTTKKMFVAFILWLEFWSGLQPLSHVIRDLLIYWSWVKVWDIQSESNFTIRKVVLIGGSGGGWVGAQWVWPLDVDWKHAHWRHLRFTTGALQSNTFRARGFRGARGYLGRYIQVRPVCSTETQHVTPSKYIKYEEIIEIKK